MRQSKEKRRSQDMRYRGTLRMLHRVRLRPVREGEEKGKEDHA